MKYCADTWFLLALFDKDERARILFHSLEQKKGWIFVSYIAYAETIRKLFQRGISEEQLQTFFTLLEASEKVRFISVDERIAREAAKVSLTYNLSLMDACIAATTKIMDCENLLSGDSDYALAVKKKYLKLMNW